MSKTKNRLAHNISSYRCRLNHHKTINHTGILNKEKDSYLSPFLLFTFSFLEKQKLYNLHSERIKHSIKRCLFCLPFLEMHFS